MDKPYIYQMAERTAAIRYEQLQAATVEKVKLCILDALECCVNPMTDGRGAAALACIPKDGPGCRSTLFGTGHKADAADAAYYNTVKACITSRNDTSMLAVCHPGNIIVSVALALAEETGASGRQIVEAVLAGYEMMIRFGLLLDGRLNPAWRYTALFGPVGAAFTAAKLCGLNVEQTASAASFACHSCCGVNEWALSGTGEDVFQNAAGARNGIFSMRLAKHGAVGCPTILEGDSGIAAAFGIRDGFEALTRDYGSGWLIGQIIHKPITSCVFVQNPCQAAAALVGRYPELAVERIDHVDVEVTAAAKNLFGTSNNERVETITHAIMSIPFGVASALLKGSAKGLSFSPPFDPRVLKLMKKCFVYENKAYTTPGHTTAKVTVCTEDGGVYSFEKEDLTPLTDGEVVRLFLETCSARIGTEGAERAERLVRQLEGLENCAELTALLA